MKALTVLGGVALALGLVSSAGAASRVGELRCHVRGGDGFIIGSVREVRCLYLGANGYRERYWGHVRRLGLDLGRTTGGVLVWDVVAPSDLRRRALAGEYVGASAEATPGIGVGANVLVGGNARTISLQPLSLSHQTGLAVAAGIGKLELR